METNKSILHAVASALSAGQSARIDVSGLGDGKVKVIYTPQIGETPEGASQEVINLRAAIARPLWSPAMQARSRTPLLPVCRRRQRLSPEV